jgi:mannose-6-phosphate isomerase-like protein (cupin superfamily)
MDKVNLGQELSRLDSCWDPKVVGELNDHQVKIAKFEGEFVWHRHEREDELFLVLEGAFDMQFRDRCVTVSQGEFIIVPRGVEHCPRADREARVLLFEPAGTVKTGDRER